MNNTILSRYMNGTKVKIWPAKYHNRLLVLEYISSKFDYDKYYTESEVNELINEYQTFGDHATVRRELYENKFLDRDNYGTKYWRIKHNIV